MRTRTTLLFALLIVAAPVHALPPGVRVGPEPAWVRPAAVADTGLVPRERVGGTYILLSEGQFNCLGPQVQHYAHRATLVLNEQGVSDVSQVSCEFDPLYQQLILHKVVVHRRGALLDRLEPSRIRLLQREVSLEESLYEGTRTALLLLDDVRPGDIVEVSYSILGENPVLAGHFGKTWSMGWDVPLRSLRRRLLWPEGRPLVIHRTGTKIEPQVERRPGVVDYTWSVENVPTVEPEPGLPSWFDPYPSVQVTDFRDWAEVARWGAPLYRCTERPAQVLQDRIHEIQKANATPERRAVAAIRFVQDEVRYLGIELGEGSHRPTPPERVLARRFGDCKDKALLLVSLLRGLGFEAYPALVNSDGGPALTLKAPSPQEFDHVVACFRYQGSTYWADATQQAERGGSLESLDVPDLGFALVLTDTTTGLTAVSPRPGARGRIVIRKDFDARQLDEPARLTVQTTYEGRDANDVRRNLHGESNEDMARRYRKYYAALYPGVEEVARPTIRDDEDANRITIHESYSIRDFWSAASAGRRRVGEFDANEAKPSFPTLGTTPRTMPLYIGSVSHVICETHARMPRGWSAPPWSNDITSGPYRLRAEVSTRGGELVTRNECSVVQAVVAADSVKSASGDFDVIADAVRYATYPGRNSAGPRTTGLNVWGVLVCLAAIALGVASARWFTRQPFAATPPAAEAPALPSPAQRESEGAGEARPPGDPGAAPAELPSAEAVAAPAPARDDALQGPPALGGWLLVLGFGVLTRPIYLLIGGGVIWRLMLQSNWLSQLRYANGGEHPGHVPLVYIELVTSAVQVVWSLVLGHLFSRRRRVFPRAYMAAMAVAILVQVLDEVAARLSGSSSAESTAGAARNIVQAVFSLAIWGAYLVRSRRVARTFVA